MIALRTEAGRRPALLRPGPGVSVLPVVAAATVLPLFPVSAPFALLDAIEADVSGGLAGQGWVLTAYAAALAGALIPAGALGDRIGHRRLLQAGLVVFALASAACAAATDVAMLVAARTAQGGAAAVVFAAALALLAHASVRGPRARALSVWGATVGAAFAAGPLVGGALVAAGAGWRASFGLLAGAALAVLVAAGGLPGEVRTRRGRVDLTAMVSLLVGICLAVVAVSRARTGGPIEGAATLAVALAALARGLRGGALADAGLLRDRGFAAGSAALFLLGAAVFGPLLCVGLFMLQVQGASPLATGAQLTPLAGTAVLASIPAAWLASRQHLALPTGLLLCAAGGAAMAAAPAAAPWTALAPGMLLAGAGTGLINPTATHAALAAAPAGSLGAAGAASNVFRQLGLALGFAGASTIVQVRVGATSGDARATAFAAGLDTALFLGAAIALAGATLCYVWLRREAAQPSPASPRAGARADMTKRRPRSDSRSVAHCDAMAGSPALDWRLHSCEAVAQSRAATCESVRAAWSGCRRWLFDAARGGGSGGRGSCLMTVELEEVAGGVDQAPFGPAGGSPAA